MSPLYRRLVLLTDLLVFLTTILFFCTLNCYKSAGFYSNCLKNKIRCPQCLVFPGLFVENVFFLCWLFRVKNPLDYFLSVSLICQFCLSADKLFWPKRGKLEFVRSFKSSTNSLSLNSQNWGKRVNIDNEWRTKTVFAF